MLEGLLSRMLGTAIFARSALVEAKEDMALVIGCCRALCALGTPMRGRWQ